MNIGNLNEDNIEKIEACNDLIKSIASCAGVIGILKPGRDLISGADILKNFWKYFISSPFSSSPNDTIEFDISNTNPEILNRFRLNIYKKNNGSKFAKGKISDILEMIVQNIENIHSNVIKNITNAINGNQTKTNNNNMFVAKTTVVISLVLSGAALVMALLATPFLPVMTILNIVGIIIALIFALKTLISGIITLLKSSNTEIITKIYRKLKDRINIMKQQSIKNKQETRNEIEKLTLENQKHLENINSIKSNKQQINNNDSKIISNNESIPILKFNQNIKSNLENTNLSDDQIDQNSINQQNQSVEQGFPMLGGMADPQIPESAIFNSESQQLQQQDGTKPKYPQQNQQIQQQAQQNLITNQLVAQNV